MAMVINSNIMSLNAQRNLTTAQADQNQAMERLTSGKRINSAADDAAGLAISNRMTSQINGLNQAVRNANDGISMIQTAEGALDESTNILQRMRELSVQSANGSYTEGNRDTLNAEVQQLVKELDRISETTSFNGQNVLDGSLGTIALQVGAESNQTIEFKIGDMDSDSLGLGSTTADVSGDRITGTTTTDIADGAVEINGQGLSTVTNLNGAAATDTQLQDVIDDINNNVDGVSASAFNTVEADAIGSGVLATGESLSITLAAADHGSDTVFTVSTETESLEELVSAINTQAGGQVKASIDEDGKLALSNTTGGAMTIAVAGGAADLNTITGITDAGADDTETFQGQIALTSDDGSAITITKGADGTDADLANLGFREVAGSGQVMGAAVASADQNDGLSANELKINGTAIAATPSVADSSSLQEIVTNINDVSDKTGVTASISAEQSFSADVSKTLVELEGAIGTSDFATAAGGTIEINGTTVTLAAGDDTADEIATKINASIADTGVSAYVSDDGALNLTSEGPVVLANGTSNISDLGIAAGTTATAAASASTTGSLTINGHDITGIDLTTLDTAVADLNAETASTGVTASIDSNGELKLSANSTITLELGDTDGMTTALGLGLTSSTTGFTSDTNDGMVASSTNSDGVNNKLVINPRIELDSANDASISVEVTSEGATATGLKNQNTSLSGTVTGSALSSIDVSTAAGAQKAIDSIDAALETVNDTRSELGAVNNRLDFTINNLSNVSENASAARSRIEDADFAAESANLSRAQVLQQAGSAMLAQANAAPQQVLSLLQ